MGQLDSESILIDDDGDDDKFIDALEEFPFFDAPNSFDFQFSLPFDNEHDTVSKQSSHTPESQSFSSSSGLRRRRLFSRQSSKELQFSRSKSNSDGSVDFHSHGSVISPRKSYKFVWNLKDNEKLNEKMNRIAVPVSSVSVSKQFTEDLNANSMVSSVTTTVTGDENVSHGYVTADSANSGSSFFSTLSRLIIKAVAFQAALLVGFVKFPVRLMSSAYKFLVDPFAIIRLAKLYAIRKILKFIWFCYGKVKWVVYLFIKRNESTFKFCLQIGWGLLCGGLVGFILFGLLVSAFVISGVILKCVMEVPVSKIEQLNFDYTRDTPTAFVPLMSCLEYDENISFGNAAQSRVVPLDHKLQATVSLNLPESVYNRNLGVFQVRVDFLSRNGKPLRSTMQPSMLHFKSQPVRLLMTFLKLAPLLTGFSSESQTLDIKFSGYTETEIPTSCLRVVLEPRAGYAKHGGIPEIYTAYLKLNSQLPFLKRMMWSWKLTIFVWMSIVMFTVGLVFALLCCMPFIVPRLRVRGVDSSNNTSRNHISSSR